LTLLAVPVAYSLLDDLSGLPARWFGRWRAEPPKEPRRDPSRPTSNGDGDNGNTVSLNLDRETILVRREPSRQHS
jgi:hypothetical protein